MQLPQEIFTYLKALSQNNNREWFHANNDQYQSAREAFVRFTTDFISTVQQLDPSIGELEAKDTIYRINRDIRFSNDKTPYKTNFCCFAALGGKKSRLPGYFFSVETDHAEMGSGLYCLDATELKHVRNEICNFPEEIVEAVENDEFKSVYRLWDNALKTFPKGYETGFRGDYLLKYKALSAITELTYEQCISNNLERIVANNVRITVPMNQFLSRALNAPDEEQVSF